MVAATAESTVAVADTAAAADTRAAAETAAAAPDTRQQAVDQLADWKSAVALVSLHQFAGMAISFGLQVDARSLTAAFVVTIVPLWCYIQKKSPAGPPSALVKFTQTHSVPKFMRVRSDIFDDPSIQKISPNLPSTMIIGVFKEILESFLFCMYFGSFTLPLSKLNEYS